MNPTTSGERQLETLSRMDKWLNMETNAHYKSLLNQAIFGVSNAMGVHPQDLAIYIMIRTNRL